MNYDAMLALNKALYMTMVDEDVRLSMLHMDIHRNGVGAAASPTFRASAVLRTGAPADPREGEAADD